MPKGPNSFFIAPDSEFILEGTIASSNDATGLYTSKTVASDSNSGSMSSFMIGTPESNTTYKLKIQDSGSNYSGTYIYKPTSTSGSDDSLLWYGEPDRRYMWDIHNPLLKNYTELLSYSSVSPLNGYFWESSVRNENIVSIQGVYFSVLNKEFIYAATFDDFVPKLWVTSRNISNQEEHWSSGTQITTLSAIPDIASLALKMNALDSNKRGLTTNYEPTYSICEHIDGKLKLAVRYNEDIDIYESTDGISFTLIAKNILSRFRDQRFVSHLKIASSGPYLKIAFVNELEELVFGKTKTDVRFLGTLTSSDGGASWDYTDIAKRIKEGGAGIRVLNSNNSLGSQNYCYDLCGLSDGSGKFVLVNGQSLIDDNIRDGRVEKEIGTANYVNFASAVNQGGADPFYMSCYVSSGNGKLFEKINLSVQNTEMSARPFIATNNDWIWLMVGGCKTNKDSGIDRMQVASSSCSEAYALSNGWNPSIYSAESAENTMFYLRIDSDLNKDKWKELGVDNFDADDSFNYFSQKLGNKLQSGRSTSCMGSYFFIPASGNLYSCASYMAFCAVGWPVNNQTLERSDTGLLEVDYGSFEHFAQYYRFSGWAIRPPYINLGLNAVDENRLDSVEKFIHQEKGLILICDYNYILGKPTEVGSNGNELSNWGQRRIGTVFTSLKEDCLQFEHIITTGASYECNFYYYRTSTVCNSSTWTVGAGQRVGSVISGSPTLNPNDTDFRYPMFPITAKVNDSYNAPQSCWTQSKQRRFDSDPDGCCIDFIFGGVTNGSVAKNTIGIKINSFTRGNEMPPGVSLSGDAILYEYFLRMAGDRIALYNTANNPYDSDYRNSAGTLEVFTMILDASKFGSSTFENSWWQGRLSFNTRKGTFSTREIGVSLSVRKLGSNLIQDSGEVNINTDSAGNIVSNTSDAFNFLGFQGISFGLFPDEDGTTGRKVKFRTLKVCQGSTMQQGNFQRNSSHSELTPVVNLIRGRKLAPNPAYIDSGQSIVWGGIGGKFNDTFDSKIKSSYNVENTIKVSSPRFEYRTKGDNVADIKSSKAEIVYQLANSTRTSNSLSGYQLNHTGLAILNTNVEKIKIEYDDNSSFTSPYVVGEKSLKLVSARVEQASNNKIRVIYDGESSARNSNRNQYTSSENTTYYAKFTTNAGVSLLNKSYKINKTFGGNLILDIPDTVLSSDPTLCPVGTTIEIYSDRMISTHALSDSTYMRITLTGHLGTTDYIKMGSLTAGTSFNLDRVPINWEHSVNVSGNVTEFNSRSGVRWAYKEGPSARTFTGEIIGDVFDDERENIENIAQQATHFNVYPVAMVFDSGRGSAFETGSDSTAKAYIDPTNILYGTINPELQMVNEGWRYDERNSEWKVIGNLQLTVVEVV